MKNKHTQGLLKVDGSGIGIYHSNPDGFGAMLAGTGMPDVSLPECQANARHFAACWNACAPITTEELESIAATGGMLGPREDVARIAKERDELLASSKKTRLVLNGKQIREIAEFAGLQFVEHDYTDEYETEIAIEDCPEKGILNDDNEPERYRLIAYLNEYPEEGCLGLGEKIEAPAIASAKGGA